MTRTPLILLMAFVSATPVFAQDLPRAEDVTSIDGIMKAYYEVVSAPAGQPKQWARDRSLHHPDAQVVIIRTNSDGNPEVTVMTLADFHGPGDGTSETGFFEYEISREVHKHGNNVHVWSTYEWRNEEDGPVGGRGVNSVQLAHDGTRWWIVSWLFDGSRDAPPVENAYLPEDRWEN
ncbi:MAG: hypothetical protein BMS9Abin05_1702 [Rhodothermia bacterium]|nr:MAG: hypothetical protein BMS9Abin05_1702 [Rhodothermia bacterium]